MLEITAMARVYGPGLTAQVRAENTYGTSDWSPTQNPHHNPNHHHIDIRPHNHDIHHVDIGHTTTTTV